MIWAETQVFEELTSDIKKSILEKMGGLNSLMGEMLKSKGSPIAYRNLASIYIVNVQFSPCEISVRDKG